MFAQLAVVMYTYVKHSMEPKAYHAGEAASTCQQAYQLDVIDVAASLRERLYIDAITAWAASQRGL
jgi:hypothetical protein